MSDLTREEAIEEIKRWTPILLNSGQCTEKTSEAQDMAISALSENKGFEGMTNRDVLKTLFPIDENKGARLTRVYLNYEAIESFSLTTTQKWLDSPYKGVSE